jgi:hypothetical protein
MVLQYCLLEMIRLEEVKPKYKNKYENKNKLLPIHTDIHNIFI